MEYKNEVKLFKALADENRLNILNLLLDGEKCGCVILEKMNITQSTLSHHMKILCDCGLVNYQKDGKWMHYSISEDKLQYLIEILNNFMKG